MTPEDRLARFGVLIDLHFAAKALGFRTIAPEVWRLSLAELEHWRRVNWARAGWTARA